MSTLRQPCPSCNRLLELPSSAVGKLAKCPACDHTFTIGDSQNSPAAPTHPPSPAAPSHDAPSGPAAPSTTPSTVPGAATNQGSAANPSANQNPPLNEGLPNQPGTFGHAATTPHGSSSAPSPDASASPQIPIPQDSGYGSTPSPSQGGIPYSNPPAGAYNTPNPNAQTGDAGPSVPNANPFSSPLESGLAASPEMNPYRPSYNPAPASPAGELRVVPRTVEEVVSATIAIFGSRWTILLVAFLLVIVVSFSVFVIPTFMFAAIADAGGEAVAAVGMLIGFPLLFLFGAYISVGLARNAIAVARNSPSPLMELLPPLGVVVRFLIGGAVMSLAAILVFGLFAGVAAALGAASGNEGLVAAIAGIGLIIGVGSGFVVYWLLWSWMFAVSDGRTTAFGSIRLAYEITMANKLTSALLLVIATVLSTAGTSLCYVGLLITQPLTNLMFATAYLLMTNQPIDDPRLAATGSYPGGPGGYPPQPQSGGFAQPAGTAGQASPTPGPQPGSGQPTSGPANSGPANSGPANSGPANSGPANSGPANSGPANSGPANSGPASLANQDPQNHDRPNSGTGNSGTGNSGPGNSGPGV